MADGDGGWGLLGGPGRFDYPETIRKPRLPSLGLQGWYGLVRSGWAGLGLTGLDF